MLMAGVYVTRRVLIVMMYTRASASDYDEWEKVHENLGWGSNELIPLLKKVYAPDLRSIPFSQLGCRLCRHPDRDVPSFR
jgi:GMC oxidoreductase